MQFGLIVFAVYYIYKNDENTAISDTNVVGEVQNEEITNIRLAISNMDVINPIVSKNQNVQDISKLIYEPLLNVTEDFKLENILAVEVSKAENKAYLVKIRENVKWHNNGDFTVDDVKYTIEQIKALGSEYIYYSNVQNIESVEIVGKNILRINLTHEEPFFEYNLTFPIISSQFFGADDLRNTEKNKLPMGTGMYKLETIDFNSQIELKLNPAWWNLKNDNPKIEKINIKFFSSVSEVYNAYKLGSIDLLNTTKNTNIEKNIGTIGYNSKENYGREFEYLALNTEKEVLSNKEVRQAVNYAINKQDIINYIYGNKYIQADYPLAYGSYLYNSEIADYEFNQGKAKQILEENGWVYSNKYWQKKIGYNNVRLRINLLVNSSNEQRVKTANMIKENLEQIGIPVNVISVKDRTYDNYIANRNYDILLTGVTVGISPNLSRYFAEGNYANYTNSEAISILNEVSKKLFNVIDDNDKKL